MTLVGTCADASGTISNATAYTGLSTGMKIAPCVVFPSGSTVTDIAADGLSFTVSPVSSEEAWKYTFTLYEPKAAGAAIVYVEAIAVSAAVAGILISGAAVMLESSFLEKAKATAIIGGGNVPFAFHGINQSFVNATVSGRNVSLAATGLISASASASSRLSGGNEALEVTFSTLAEASAEISGHLVFVQALGLNSVTADAKATATANRYLAISSSTPVKAVAVVSGLNIYV